MLSATVSVCSLVNSAQRKFVDRVWQLVDSLAVGPGSERKWRGIYDHKTDGSWDRTAEKMLLNFEETNHAVFRGTIALVRGEIRCKGSGKKLIHFNDSTQNIELLLQTVISVNQLSMHGTVADMIEEIPVGQSALVKLVASCQLEKVEILTSPLFAEMKAN